MLPTGNERPKSPGLDRRQLLAYAGFGAAAMTEAGSTAVAALQATATVERRSFNMKKSINLWAFPYPGKMTLRQCLQLAKDAGFDGIELNYDLDSDLSPKSGTKEFTAIRKMAEEIGIAISGVCSFLFWPHPQRAFKRILKEEHRPFARSLPPAARRHHQLARRDAGV